MTEIPNTHQVNRHPHTLTKRLTRSPSSPSPRGPIRCAAPRPSRLLPSDRTPPLHTLILSLTSNPTAVGHHLCRQRKNGRARNWRRSRLARSNYSDIRSGPSLSDESTGYTVAGGCAPKLLRGRGPEPQRLSDQVGHTAGREVASVSDGRLRSYRVVWKHSGRRLIGVSYFRKCET